MGKEQVAAKARFRPSFVLFSAHGLFRPTRGSYAQDSYWVDSGIRASACRAIELECLGHTVDRWHKLSLRNHSLVGSSSCPKGDLACPKGWFASGRACCPCPQVQGVGPRIKGSVVRGRAVSSPRHRVGQTERCCAGQETRDYPSRPQRSGWQVLTFHLHFLTLYLPPGAKTHSHFAHDVVHVAGTSKEPAGWMARGAPEAGASARPRTPTAAIKPMLCNLPMLPLFPINNGDYRMKRETPKGTAVAWAKQ
jgi:hypothetical protein